MCEIEDCDNKSHAKGMCAKHYQRFYRFGHTDLNRAFGVRNYRAQHKYLDRTYGKAKEQDCAVCFEAADEWAFIKEWCPDEERKTHTGEFPNGKSVVVPFSNNEGHYISLCISHHKQLDAGEVFYA